jgi:tRNA(Ile)-lysidine synthase
MLEAFKEHVALNFPELFQNRLVLACSGGLDSTVLAYLIAALHQDFVLAHVNFKLREGESEGDAAFVRNLAAQLGVSFELNEFQTLQYASKRGISTQMAARELRYSWFNRLVEQGKGTLVLTAHHADDALETFFINLNRASGIDGLSGIPTKTGNIRRPLLAFSRSEIEDYAHKNKIQWREDSSNASDYYLRNQIRHTLIPVLKEIFPNISANLGSSQEHLRESRQLIDNYISDFKSQLLREEGDELYLDCARLLRATPLKAHLFKIFRPYGFTDWKAIAGLLEGESGKEVFSPSHRLLKNRNHLVLKPRESITKSESFTFSLDRTDHLPVKLIIFETSKINGTGPNCIYVDGNQLTEPLCLRKWKKGDYFFPFGMKGRKLISKFYKDIGLSQFQKEEQWLLCCGEDIVWILGKRADERFRVTSETQHILKIEWEK